jgi:hypothetical protein
MSAKPPHTSAMRVRMRPTPASAACTDRGWWQRMVAEDGGGLETIRPPRSWPSSCPRPRGCGSEKRSGPGSKTTTNVLIAAPLPRRSFSEGYAPCSPRCVSSPGTSPWSSAPHTTRVRLNRSQMHRPKDRSRWFIGVHSRSTAGERALYRSGEGLPDRARKVPYRSRPNPRARAKASTRFRAPSLR